LKKSLEALKEEGQAADTKSTRADSTAKRARSLDKVALSSGGPYCHGPGWTTARQGRM